MSTPPAAGPALAAAPAALAPLPVPPSPARATAAAARAARTKLLLEGPIAPTLARLAAPNVVAMGVMAATSIAEGVFAGLLGVSALAGLALVFPLVMLTQMLSAGAFGGAISSALARALGAGDSDRAERLVWHAGIVAAAAAALSALLVAVWGAPLFALLGGHGPALQAALAYAGIFFPGCIAVWLCHTCLSLLRGTGNMAMPSQILLLVSLVSIPLSGALALGWGPFPALGMTGLAAGIVIAHVLGAVLALGYLATGRAGLDPLRGLAPLQAALFRDILKVGLIASLSAVQTVFTIVVMVGLVGRFGEAALAGYGLGARLEFLMVPVVFGIGAAMTAMVGANTGAGQHRRAQAIAWTGSFAAAGLVGGIGLFFAAFPDLWLGLFVAPGDAATLAAGRAYFGIAAPFYGFFALGLGLYFAGQGAGRVLGPVLAGLARAAVAVGGGLALTAWTDLGLAGVFLAIAAGMVTFGLAAGLWVHLARRR
ncbi:MAG: MATE family efflux transporter [Sneathiellaceae bacterium]